MVYSDRCEFMKEKMNDGGMKFSINCSENSFYPYLEKTATKNCQSIAYEKLLKVSMLLMCELKHVKKLEEFMNSANPMNCFSDHVEWQTWVNKYKNYSSEI